MKSFLNQSKEIIKKIEEKEKELLKKNCPHCNLFPELKVRFKVQSSKEVCSKGYLNKKYDYKKSFKLKLKNSKCDKERLHNGLEEYMRNILEKNASDEAKKLWAACPDLCSFDTGFSIRINESSCIGSIDLTVLCVNPNRGFFGPKYDATIEYKKGLQCKK